jgi:hypothetical protein
MDRVSAYRKTLNYPVGGPCTPVQPILVRLSVNQDLASRIQASVAASGRKRRFDSPPRGEADEHPVGDRGRARREPARQSVLGSGGGTAISREARDV